MKEIKKPSDYAEQVTAILDAKDVTFVWSEDEAGRITELVATVPAENRALYDDDRFPNARGSSDLGWMEDPRHTPEALFMGLLEIGFADRHWFEAAVIEFARLEQCEWARRLAQLLR